MIFLPLHLCTSVSVSPVRVFVQPPSIQDSPVPPLDLLEGPDDDFDPFFCPLQKSFSLPSASISPLESPSAFSTSLDTTLEESELISPPNSISALIVAPPSADAFFRAHRHSIPGHRLTNYLKFLHELAAQGSTIAKLFSTAVISGSSSAPNLQKEMPCFGENVGKLDYL